MSKAKIRLENISKSFYGENNGDVDTEVLRSVSLDINDGEFICLLGPSGSGKSTVLNLVAGFDTPDLGRILLDDTEIRGAAPQRGMVFQQATLFPWLSVWGNVTFGPRMTGISKAKYEDAARRYIRLVGLEAFTEHYPWQLSGGMRQRVALARAWLPNPEVLLMDEPFGALDAQTRLVMQELLTEIWMATRTTILFVTHDVDEALFLADKIVLLGARPGQVRTILPVPFARPRDPENILLDPEYGRLKREILHIVREEASKSLATH